MFLCDAESGLDVAFEDGVADLVAEGGVGVLGELEWEGRLFRIY